MTQIALLLNLSILKSYSMKKINVFLMCICSLFFFTGCNTNEFEENGESNVSKDIDIETLKDIHNDVGNFFLESATIDEMATHLDEIKAMKGIAEAWTTDDALYVKTDDGITCFWLYPNDLQADEEDLYNAVKQMTRSIVLGDAEDHDILRPHKIAIINQQSSDGNRYRVKRITILKDLKDEFVKAGFKEVDDIDQKGADLNFFSSKIKEYDIIFLLTHGAYFPQKESGKHELLTGEDISFVTDTDQINDTLRKWEGGVSIGTVKEEVVVYEGGYEYYVSIPKTYFTINEDFISKNIKGSLNDAIIFNAACHSLQGSESLADAFGAKTYIGYNEVSGYGTIAADVFFRNMLEGLHVGDAFAIMGQHFPKYIKNNAELKIVGSKNVCIIHPHVEATEPGEITSTTVVLNGKMTEWHETLNKDHSMLGFCWSSTDKNPKMNNTNSNSCSKFVASYRDSVSKDRTCNFNEKMEGLSPNTTYYYRPFLYMNKEYYYGDVKEVTTKEEEKIEEDDIRAYLVKLYHDTDGDNWEYKDNWLSDKPVIEWYGVHRGWYNGVYSIELQYNNLNGSIDISGCKLISKFICTGNNLTSLNVSGCTKLESLYSKYCNLTSLNASGCTELGYLDCDLNNLESLDVEGTSLYYLSCKFNRIISEIPPYFRDIRDFYHDQLYQYYWDYNHTNFSYKKNEYGWFYPGEPESGKHDWPSSDAPRRQKKQQLNK